MGQKLLGITGGGHGFDVGMRNTLLLPMVQALASSCMTAIAKQLELGLTFNSRGRPKQEKQ
jgi:hypothetical protein